MTSQDLTVKLDSYLRTDIPVSIVLPAEVGGYVLVAEFTPENGGTVISRRFLKIGESPDYKYFKVNPILK